ncbi:MAG: hybrid sensor histidine kinase/response regulator [Candidatus Bathyarchaeota archaeon]|nr:hybrid sensor histidine kinase/response regulator [Candidatus Bathyarchaeota archaeon]
MTETKTTGFTEKISVLHVDDDPTILDVSKQILEVEGRFRVTCASSVDEAFKLLGTQLFDAVISDYEMPSKSGLEFLEELRGRKNEIAFVMFTGRGREEVAMKALNLGADRYINKTGDPEAVYCELSYALTKIVERKKTRHLLLDDAKKISELNEKLRVVGSLTRHDIRNKLSALNGHVFLLKTKLQENPQAANHIDGVELAAKQIAELLDFAHLYEKLGVEELKNVDVKQCVDDAFALFPRLKNIQLTNNCQDLTVLADSLLRQLFFNLIDNTLKHGGNPTNIRIHYQTTDNHIKLVYEDNGVGIPDHLRENLFTQKLPNERSHGLYVVNRICQAYNWTMQETGQNMQGAQFTIHIPKKQQKTKPPQVL